MRHRFIGVFVVPGISFFLLFNMMALGQQLSESTIPPATVPRLITFNGVFRDRNGQPLGSVVGVSFGLFRDQQGGAALWTESQNVQLDRQGQYTVLLGVTQAAGLPNELFTLGEPRWLDVQAQLPGLEEQPRILLASVPYALKASDADTIGGMPVSAFVLALPEGPPTSRAIKSNAGKSGTDNQPTVSALSGTGTANRIVRWADANGTLSDSSIQDNAASTSMTINAAGYLGIGTTTPNVPLELKGGASNQEQLRLENSGTGSRMRFTQGGSETGRIESLHDGIAWTLQLGAYPAFPTMTLRKGNIGIGTTTPNVPLELKGGASNQEQLRLENSGTGSKMRFTQGGAETGRIESLHDGIAWTLQLGAYPAFPAMIIRNGNVGIGTIVPATKLDVAGDINVSGNIAAKYQDVAEWVETHGPVEPGTVVVIDLAEPNRVLPATKAYDTRVAGAISAKPGIALGDRSDSKSLVAQSGRVRVKVDAKYGAIKIGDLLVTSPTPGHAMRSRPIAVGAVTMHRPGTILGKALEALPGGKGEILVLLTLQ